MGLERRADRSATPFHRRPPRDGEILLAGANYRRSKDGFHGYPKPPKIPKVPKR